MSKVSNTSLRIVVRLLVLLAVAKAISLALWWFLPDDGVEPKERKNFNPPYQRVDFKNMLSAVQNPAKKENAALVGTTSVGITSMILKGLYGNATKGFIIVALKSNPAKTNVVGVGESYSGYRLKSILKDGALFTKGGKEFVLKIKRSKTNLKSAVTPVRNSSPATHTVSRSDIDFYEKHPENIWQDISIMELKNGKKINGFRVTRVRKNSKMDHLGLKRGDVIIRANNVELTSYKSVFDLYKNIKKIDTLQLVVLRNNEEKELVYEIH
jgi:type II secretion system protein C